jgi:hypothetical protein
MSFLLEGGGRRRTSVCVCVCCKRNICKKGNPRLIKPIAVSIPEDILLLNGGWGQLGSRAASQGMSMAEAASMG